MEIDMAEDREDGAGASVHELSANAVRDVREVLRSEELPAQWEKFSLRTQQEMLAGRNAIAEGNLVAWADEGEAWLREQFRGKGLVFHTTWSIDNRTITLSVYRPERKRMDKNDRLLFKVTEKAESFVSHTTLTKIILVA